MGMVLIGVAILLLGAFALAAYTTWFVRQATGAFPFCRVGLSPSEVVRGTRAEVTLVGTGRTFHLRRIVHEAAGDSELPVPEGFEREQDHGMDEGTVSWIPRTPVRFRPGKPVAFEFAHGARQSEPIRVSGWLEARVGVGGTGTFFHVLVGPLPNGRRAYLNMSSRLRAESVTQGIRPVDHAEWDELKRLEDEIDS